MTAEAVAPTGALQKAGGLLQRMFLYIIVFVPFATLIASIPLARRGGWVTPLDIGLMVIFYAACMIGVGVGFHRLFTHRSFKVEKRWLKNTLAIAGSMAIEGTVIRWVSDHRKHHANADREGDPHSPWRYGETLGAVIKGLFYAHTGWLFDKDASHGVPEDNAPDMLKDDDLALISKLFPLIVVVSLLMPGLIGLAATQSWHGFLTAMIWGTGVRVAMVHHVTWSVNSICHIKGEQPFDGLGSRAGNVWWLAILTLGEAWHNLHHSAPKLARHGVLPHQIDINARIIRFFEKRGWATNVRWPSKAYIEELISRKAAVIAASAA